MVSPPVIKPLADGLNLTCMLQLLPGRRGAVQVFVWMKFALVLMLLTLSEALPLLLSVTVLAALVVPTDCFLKLRVVGVTEPIAIGVGFAVGVGVDVRVAVPVAVAVELAVAVAVGVRVGVAVPVAVAVGVGVARADAVAVGVGVAVAVGGGGPLAPNAITEAE
jgi:hypothetical protein